MKNEDIGRRAATEFRKEINLGTDPINSLVWLIEHRMGVGVAFVKTNARGHGLTVQRGSQTMIAVGCTPHPMRLRSTLAHEIGHLRLGTVSSSPSNSGWQERSCQEIQADAFARHLLLPLDSVRTWCESETLTLVVLSNLVQHFGVSPKIAAIQLREAGFLDEDTADHWGNYSTRTLAQRFGWRSRYETMVAEALTPRAPQALFTRATYAYEWGLVSAAALARLNGSDSAIAMAKQLEEAGITPQPLPDITASRPQESKAGLTEAERLALSEAAD
ncbi:MAG: ImmA/IrrE family metallo-endopeptidase [Actinomycetaceae bacterium]|nr:ImmA/IrrE family metallo-endopeptidase [Actinomycetaceae bacterium]